MYFSMEALRSAQTVSCKRIVELADELGSWDIGDLVQAADLCDLVAALATVPESAPAVVAAAAAAAARAGDPVDEVANKWREGDLDVPLTTPPTPFRGGQRVGDPIREFVEAAAVRQVVAPGDYNTGDGLWYAAKATIHMAIEAAGKPAYEAVCPPGTSENWREGVAAAAPFKAAEIARIRADLLRELEAATPWPPTVVKTVSPSHWPEAREWKNYDAKYGVSVEWAQGTPDLWRALLPGRWGVRHLRQQLRNEDGEWGWDVAMPRPSITIYQCDNGGRNVRTTTFLSPADAEAEAFFASPDADRLLCVR